MLRVMLRNIVRPWTNRLEGAAVVGWLYDVPGMSKVIAEASSWFGAIDLDAVVVSWAKAASLTISMRGDTTWDLYE